MTSRPRKTATARRAARPKESVSTVLNGPVEALNFDEMTPRPDNPETVHLFTLNGTDYYVPAEPGGDVLLGYMRLVRINPDAAEGWVLERVLGDEAHTALMSWPGLTIDMLQQLMVAVRRLVLGASGVITGPLGRG